MVRLTTYDSGYQAGLVGGSATRVVVFDTAWDKKWLGNGEAVQIANRLAVQVTAKAYANAPTRTGTLKRGIRVRKSRSTGKRRVMSQVRSDAKHSLWVHEGTGKLSGGRIRSTRPGGRLLLTAGNGYPAIGTTPAGRPYSHKIPSVRGQKSNPFLRNALNEVWRMERRADIRRMRPRLTPVVIGGAGGLE